MKRFKNILVIPSNELSANDPALVRAVKLANHNAARLTVFYPVEQYSDYGSGLEYLPDIIRFLKEKLETMVEPARKKGVTTEVLVRYGRPFVEIIKQVREAGHDLVMKTARGHKLHKSLMFGTTALHLLRKCPCPVWVVDPKGGKRRGILAAVDPDTTNEQSLTLSRTIMELATSLSSLERMELHVAHAWSVPHEDIIRHLPWLRAARDDVDSYAKDIEERHRERFVGLIGQFRGYDSRMETHFVRGVAEEIIPAIVKEKNIEVVVMGAVARTGIPGMLIGNVAEEVINQVDCSVLAIKPEGFVSPIAT